MDRIRKALEGTAGCRVEVWTSENAEAKSAGRRLARVFQSCGYRAETRIDPKPSRDGVHIESRNENAGAALTLQSAFHAAGIHATVAIFSDALSDAIVVHIGPGGIS